MSSSDSTPHDQPLSPDEVMQAIDVQLGHVWMVRAFLKHSDEAEDVVEVQDAHRELYDFMLAVGGPWREQDSAAYLKLAHKKFPKLRKAAEAFAQAQPEISSHTNFEMAARSLTAAVDEIGRLLGIKR